MRQKSGASSRIRLPFTCFESEVWQDVFNLQTRPTLLLLLLSERDEVSLSAGEKKDTSKVCSQVSMMPLHNTLTSARQSAITGGSFREYVLHCMYYVNVLYIYLLVQDGAVCIRLYKKRVSYPVYHWGLALADETSESSIKRSKAYYGECDDLEIILDNMLCFCRMPYSKKCPKHTKIPSKAR